MGAGSAWGDREEFLHPRDSHGRFRNTWRMPQAAADAIAKFLDGFSPKTFASDQAAQSWVHNESRKNRLNTNSSSAISNFVKGFSNVNNNLRAGKADPQAAQMLKGAEPLPNDLILTKTVDGSAFGLGPDNIANVEELTGKLIHDPGFTSANIGTPNPPTGPGPHIQMTIATPAGTKAIIPQVTSPTSEVMLTPDQNLRVTKVTPDGKGGFYMMAVATPGGVPNEKSTPLHEAPPAPAPLNLPPKPGETPAAPATPGSAPAAPETAPGSVPATPGANAPAASVAPRSEPNVVEALTPGGTPTPAAQPAGAPSAPETPAAAEVPAGPVDFRQAVKDANIPSPTEGPRRKQWNTAYLGVVSGKKHPQDALRELRADIEHNKGIMADDVKTNTDSGPLPNDIKAQEALANLIEEKFNLGAPKPAEKAPEVKAPEAPKRRGPKTITKEEMPNKAEIRRESRARTPAPTAAETKRAEEVKALGIKSGEEAAAKTAADTAAAQKTSEPWLEKAGIRGADLTDHERLGVMLMATQINNKKISRPEAARRLRGDGKNERLARIADAITARPSKATPVAAKAAPAPSAAEGTARKATAARLKDTEIRAMSPEQLVQATKDGRLTKERATKVLETRVADLEERVNKVSLRPSAADKNRTTRDERKALKELQTATPTTEGAIPEKATIAQLRQIANDRGVKIPSKLTRKADIRAHLEGGGAPSAPAKPSVEDRLATHLLNKLPENVRKDVLENMSPADRRIVDEAVQRVQGSEAELKKAGAGGAIPEKATIADLRKIAGDRNIKIPSKITRKDDIRAFIEGGGKPSGPSGVELARTRQGHIDEARKTASLLSGLDGALADGASTQALTKKLGTDANRLGIPDATRERLLKAVDTGDEKKIRAEIDKVAKEAGLTVHSGNAGSTTTFDLAKHTGTGEGLKPGQKVNVVRPGHEATLPGGEKVQLSKATVESAAAEEAIRRTPGSAPAKAAALAKKAAPSTPLGVSSKDVKEGDAVVWQPPGETPVLGHVVRKGRFTYVRWNTGREEPLRANRRDPSLRKATEADIKELGGSSKAVSKIEAPEELKQAVARTSIADLRKQAEAEGIKIPASAKTKQQIVDHIAQTMAARELARRGVAKATAPKVAKKAEPEVKAPSIRSITSRRIAERAQAERAAVQANKFSDKPILKNHWGEFGAGEVGFHPDSEIGKALRFMGEDKKLDINGEPLANVAGRLATDGVRGRKTAQEVVDELRALTERLPEDSAARRALSNAVREMDAPKRTISLPSGTPKPMVDLARKLEQIPLARRTHTSTGHEERIQSELTQLGEIADRYSKGELSGIRLISIIRGLHNHRHESQEGKIEMDRAIETARKELEAIGFRNLNPPKKEG
jgi:hypothetical protein